jgi:hypothetical protein
MRLFVIAALLALSVVALREGSAHENQAKPSEKENATTNSTQQNEVPISAPSAHLVSAQQSPPSPPEQDNVTHYYQQPANDKSAWVLVGINFLYLIVSGLTFLAIYKQAKHMSDGIGLTNRQLALMETQIEVARESAKAAQTSAEALMSGERAWLLVDGIKADPDFAKQGTPSFTYSVVNYGKTPGFMRSAKAYVRLVYGMDCPDDRDFDFMEQDGSICEDVVVIPKGEPLILYGNDLSMGERRFSWDDTNSAEWPKIFTQGPSAYLWAVGSIHYHDVFGELRHTPFAYWYSVAEKKFVRVRFPGLNKPS